MAENEDAVTTVEQELNLDKKVTIKNLSNWEVAFMRVQEGIGAVRIMPGGTQRISRGEIIAQIQNGNKLFTGTDGMGSHATVLIEDKPTRVEAGFEDDTREQQILTASRAKKLFALPQNKYESEFEKMIVTRAEKHAIMEYIVQAKVNDYAKIKFAETHTHCKL